MKSKIFNLFEIQEYWSRYQMNGAQNTKYQSSIQGQPHDIQPGVIIIAAVLILPENLDYPDVNNDKC